MSSPRISRIRLSETVNRFSPPNRISPPTISPGGPTSRINESAVIDLPHPDSPTSPRRSPSSSGKRTPSTARTSPARVRKCVRRFLTSSRCDILCREYARKSRETSRERRGRLCRVARRAPVARREVEEEAEGDDARQHRPPEEAEVAGGRDEEVGRAVEQPARREHEDEREVAAQTPATREVDERQRQQQPEEAAEEERVPRRPEVGLEQAVDGEVVGLVAERGGAGEQGGEADLGAAQSRRRLEDAPAVAPVDAR